MFSGIVESQGKVVAARAENGVVRIDVERPTEFDDLKVGDSICVNGVCLTVERFDSSSITFAIGGETLKITGWSPDSLRDSVANLERSLRFADRIHGHLVSGHVDATCEVVAREELGGSVRLAFRVPETLAPFLWRKGSCAINGVSLTINEVNDATIDVCLIPETLKRTNLKQLERGGRVNVEVDMMARGLIHFLETAPARRTP